MGCNGSKNTLFRSDSDLDGQGPSGWPTVEELRSKRGSSPRHSTSSVLVRVVSGNRRSSGDRSRSRSGRAPRTSEYIVERLPEETKVHGAQTALSTLLEEARTTNSVEKPSRPGISSDSDRGSAPPTARRKGRQWGYIGALRPLPELRLVRLPNGEDVAVRTHNPDGQVSTLVFLHGAIGDHLLWREVVEHPALAGTRLVTLDLRGSGASSYNRPVTSHAELAADVAHVLNVLQLQGCTLVGHSSGAATAAEVAAREPGLVASLCLVSAVPPGGISSCRPRTGACGALVSTKADWEGHAPAASHRWTLEKWKRLFLDPSMAMLPAGSDRWDEVMRSFVQQRNASDLAWADYSFNITAVANPCCAGSNAVANITCPVFFIHGEHDTVLPAFDVTQHVGTQAGDTSRATVLPLLQAGHLPMLECLDNFVELLLQCLPSADAQKTSMNDTSLQNPGMEAVDSIPVAVA